MLAFRAQSAPGRLAVPVLRFGQIEGAGDMKRQDLEELFYGKRDHERRFTQDFPILPDVWFAYAREEDENWKKDDRLCLLLTPHNMTDAPMLAKALRDRLHAGPPAARTPPIIFNESVVLAEFSFREVLRIALPLSDWWMRVIGPVVGSAKLWQYKDIMKAIRLLREHKPGKRFGDGDPKLLLRLVAIVGAIECERNGVRRESNDQKQSPSLLYFISERF